MVAKRADDTTRLRRELAQAEQDASELQEMVLEADARHEADKVRSFISHPQGMRGFIFCFRNMALPCTSSRSHNLAQPETQSAGIHPCSSDAAP